MDKTELDLDDLAAQSQMAATELAALRKDAERYRWHKARNPVALLAVAWGASKDACAIGDDPDAATDAAMAETTLEALRSNVKLYNFFNGDKNAKK